MRRDDEREFAEWVGARLPALLRYAHVLTGDPVRAEDLVQRALASAYRHWHRIDRRGADAYVRRAALKAYLSRWARPRHRERPVAAVDERDQVWHALTLLPRRQRAVVVLRFYEDLTETEIADLLGLTPGTVKSLASKALASLRRTLDAADTLPAGGRP